eukprot:UN25093
MKTSLLVLTSRVYFIFKKLVFNIPQRIYYFLKKLGLTKNRFPPIIAEGGVNLTISMHAPYL